MRILFAKCRSWSQFPAWNQFPGIRHGQIAGAVGDTVLPTMGNFLLTFDLAYELLNLKVAWGTVFVLILLIPNAMVNPILNSRQVLRDIPAAINLHRGYVFVLLIRNRSPWMILGVLLCWGLALITKARTQPFWLAFQLGSLGLAVLHKSWKSETMLGMMVIGSWIAATKAMLCGRPVATVDIRKALPAAEPVSPEILARAPADPEAFAGQVLSLIRNEKYARNLVESGYKYVKENHTISSMGPQYQDLFLSSFQNLDDEKGVTSLLR